VIVISTGEHFGEQLVELNDQVRHRGRVQAAFTQGTQSCQIPRVGRSRRDYALMEAVKIGSRSM
jgi:hypothetical protein